MRIVDKEKKILYVIKETFLESFLREIITFGVYVSAMFINYKYIGNSLLVGIAMTLFFFIGFFVWAYNLQKSIYVTPEEAIEKLNKYTEEGSNGNN